MGADEGSQWRARIPADVDRPEPVAFGLTGRQLIILAPVALVMWALFLALKDSVDVRVLAACAVPVAGAALVAALAQRDGAGLDRLALAALAWARSPKRRVGAPDGIPELPAWAPKPSRRTRGVRGGRGSGLEPLRLPARAITEQGAIDVGDRHVAIVACSTVNFHLATGREQDAMAMGFAGVLDALTDPVQILIHSRPFDVSPFTGLLRANASHLAHEALERAALAHAEFLTDLAAHRELTQRRVLVVVTARTAATVLHTARDVAAQLQGIGIRAHVCDGPDTEDILRAFLNPAHEPADTGNDTEEV